MKSNFQTLILVGILSNLTLFSVPVFAEDLQSSMDQANVSYENYNVSQESLLYKEDNIYEPSGHYVSPEINAQTSDKINVFYENNSISSYSIITIERKTESGWKFVASMNVPVQQKRFFTVLPSENVNFEATNLSGTKIDKIIGSNDIVYRVKIDSADGSPVEGNVRINKVN